MVEIAFFNSFENASDTKKCVIRWLAKNNKRQDRKPNCFIHPIVLFGQKGLPQKDSVCQHQQLFFSHWQKQAKIIINVWWFDDIAACFPSMRDGDSHGPRDSPL